MELAFESRYLWKTLLSVSSLRTMHVEFLAKATIFYVLGCGLGERRRVVENPQGLSHILVREASCTLQFYLFMRTILRLPCCVYHLLALSLYGNGSMPRVFQHRSTSQQTPYLHNPPPFPTTPLTSSLSSPPTSASTRPYPSSSPATRPPTPPPCFPRPWLRPVSESYESAHDRPPGGRHGHCSATRCSRRRQRRVPTAS